MSRNLNDDSKQIINELRKQLSNNSRELQLNEQIVHQLEKIRSTSVKLREILNRLLYEIADLSDQELKDLHHKEHEAKVELKKLEMRYELLKSIQTIECSVGVKAIPLQTRNHKFMINNQIVPVQGFHHNQDEDDVETDVDDDTEIDDRSDRSLSASDVSSVSYLANGFSQRLSARKRIIPERFESFPSKKRSKRFHGMNGKKFFQ